LEYKDTLKSLTKTGMVMEMSTVFSQILKAYVNKEPIYYHIYSMKDILDVLLERCK
jgi:hypothetical protein